MLIPNKRVFKKVTNLDKNLVSFRPIVNYIIYTIRRVSIKPLKCTNFYKIISSFYLDTGNFIKFLSNVPDWEIGPN